MSFGPNDQNEAVIFALEGLRADFQYAVLKQLKRLGLSQAELARRIGVSGAWVSQILSDDANVTLESMARVFAALGVECGLKAGEVDTEFKRAADIASRPSSGWLEMNSPSDVKTKSDSRSQGEVSSFIQIVVGRGYRRPRMSTASNHNGSTVNHWDVAA